MALKGSSLPSLAAATKELWPTIARTVTLSLGASWSSPASRPLPPPMASPEPTGRAKADMANANLGAETRNAVPSHDAASVRKHVPSVFNIRSPIPNMSRGAFLVSNPVMNPFSPQHAILRPLSTLATCRASVSSSPLLRMTFPQRRYFRGGDVSRNLLAYAEETANRNPGSATAQNAFYQALLRANLPAIVIERYRTGQFATNAAVEEAYQKAVNMLSPSCSQGVSAKQSPELTTGQIQAIQAAVANYKHSGNAAVIESSPGASSSGAKDSPLHVTISESRSSLMFKYFKAVLWILFIAYLTMVIIALLTDAINSLKRTGGGKDVSEVKDEQQKARFADVHGCDEAKEELQELVEFLRNPEKFSALGGKLPKGVLLAGPPGTGKTLLARAVAGEAGVPFFYMSGSEFDEVFVGVGAKRVRALFAAAKAKGPAIIFIDELDAVGSRRSTRDAAYHKQTLNQLLTELDGFDQDSSVVVIGATNFPQSLDKALIRPGRFDRHVRVDLPDVRGRMAILKHHARNVKIAEDVNLQDIASTTSGLSGAELENIVNQAAVHASKNKALSVGHRDFDWAKDKIIMGAERKHVITPEEKEMTAYHEAGHALVALFTNNDAGVNLYKVTVLARGMSLGHTSFIPDMDKYSFSSQNFLASMDRLMAGKLAEEIVYGVENITSGASNDLEHATKTAFEMVAKMGMSPKLGHMDYKSRYEHLSNETKARIEAEVTRLLDESYERCRKMLTDHRKELDLLAKALVDYETLSKDEVEKVIRGEKLPDRMTVPRGPMVVSVPETPTHVDDGGSSPPQPTPPAPGGIASREP